MVYYKDTRNRTIVSFRDMDSTSVLNKPVLRYDNDTTKVFHKGHHVGFVGMTEQLLTWHCMFVNSLAQC